MRRLPDKTAGEAAAECEGAEESKTPVLCLHPGRADALIPDLACALIGRFRFRSIAVAHTRTTEHGVILLPKDSAGGRYRIGRRSELRDLRSSHRVRSFARASCAAPKLARWLIRSSKSRFAHSKRRSRASLHA